MDITVCYKECLLYAIFIDFVVGAPYDGEDRQGAVYVYHGTADGVREQYTQRIFGRDVSSELRSFGFSLAGGRDIDRNDYPGRKICYFIYYKLHRYRCWCNGKLQSGYFAYKTCNSS